MGQLTLATVAARTVAACTVALGLTACGPASAMGIYDAKYATVSLSDGVSPDTVERTRRRTVRPATDVVIDATLWDGAMVAAGVRRGIDAGLDETTAAALRQRWVSHYLDKRTAFTVVIELANRPGAAKAADPLTLADAWTFTLDRGAERDLAAKHVELEAVDRFPTEAGGHHLRLAFAVRFEGAALDAANPSPTKLRLKVRADGTQPGWKRREMGRRMARHGAMMSWWINGAVVSRSSSR